MKVKIVTAAKEEFDEVPSLNYEGLEIEIRDLFDMSESSSPSGKRDVMVLLTYMGKTTRKHVTIESHEHPLMALSRIHIEEVTGKKSKKIVIGLHGKARAGKDTVASFIKKIGKQRGKKVQTIALAEPIKRMSSVIFDMDLETLEAEKEDVQWTGFSHRKFCQLLGTELVRVHFGDDFWIRYLNRKIENSIADVIVITDVRFENEVKNINDNDAGVLVHIVRDSITITGESAKHASEAFTASEDQVDHLILNNYGLDMLEREVQYMLDRVLKGV